MQSLDPFSAYIMWLGLHVWFGILYIGTFLWKCCLAVRLVYARFMFRYHAWRLKRDVRDMSVFDLLRFRALYGEDLKAMGLEL